MPDIFKFCCILDGNLDGLKDGLCSSLPKPLPLPSLIFSFWVMEVGLKLLTDWLIPHSVINEHSLIRPPFLDLQLK